MILQAQGGDVATESPPAKAKPKAETATPKEAKDGGENGVGNAVKWLGFVEGRPACSRISGFLLFLDGFRNSFGM